MNKKILICDDTKFMRVTLKNSLEKEGYQVVDEAENGEMLIEKYKQLNPDLIIVDITMPVMDGISALSSIMEINSSAKVIICSAMGQDEVVIRAIKAGAKDFIVKPFKTERLIESVKKVLGN
ncbi:MULTISPECIES: response regulator [unclassified Clostridium]|uniref:response regulator n=1 Tax=unclassified Clostridium TaxID=2614128 RepID=UPI00029868D6|nr:MULTISPECIES: response regulator [unclassified Clostridium]EKQ56629.1 MAG: response regulator (CheY-like, AAA-type ATPase, and DNA-binding domain containing protein) [Clostridium sp. Maddingley MBC34-26]